MKNKTVLIVTYYWPPAGGPGVQRPYYFAKYLRQLGWTVIIYTVENNLQLGIDDSYDELDVTVFKSHVPFLQKKNTGKSFVDDTGFITLIKKWTRGNLLIPDAKIFWLLKANKVIKQIKLSFKPDIAFITGPPQTTHLVGKRVKQICNIPTVHDFRDPWTSAYFLSDFPRLKLADKIDKRLEQSVIDKADGIITVSDSLSLPIKGKVRKVIPNGFDSEIYSVKNVYKKRMIYTGMLAESQISEQFLISLSEQGIQLDFYGSIHKKVYDFVEQNNLKESVKFYNTISHSELLKIQTDTDFFLLLIPNVKHNSGILTGKLFEYLAANRPILAIGPTTGDCAKILNESGIGKMYEYDSNFEEVIQEFMTTDFKMNHEYVAQFSRKELTKTLSGFMSSFL